MIELPYDSTPIFPRSEFAFTEKIYIIIFLNLGYHIVPFSI